MRKYYILKVTTGFEYTVAESLKKTIEVNEVGQYLINPTVPEQTVTRVVRGKKKEVDTKCYPGYVFIEMDVSDNHEDPNYWKKMAKIIFSISNIVSFVGVNRTEKPVPLKRNEVKAYLSNIGELDDVSTKRVSDVEFDEGEKIRVIDGAFNGFEGFVKEIDVEKEKISVEVDIFGRKTPVELSFMQVEKLTS